MGEPPGLPSSQRRGQLQPIPNLPALPDRLGLSGAEAGGWLLWCGAWDPRQALSGHSQGAKLGEGGRLVGLGWRKESGGPRQKPGRAAGEKEMLLCFQRRWIGEEYQSGRSIGSSSWSLQCSSDRNASFRALCAPWGLPGRLGTQGVSSLSLGHVGENTPSNNTHPTPTCAKI